MTRYLSDRLEPLPEPGERRWTRHFKDRVVKGVISGEISFELACRRWGLSEEKLNGWLAKQERSGGPALRVKATQWFRQLRKRK
jgi:transposase-like protein